MKGIVVTVALFSPPGKPKHREFLTSFVFVPQLAEGIVSEAMRCEFESHRRHQLGKLNELRLKIRVHRLVVWTVV